LYSVDPVRAQHFSTCKFYRVLCKLFFKLGCDLIIELDADPARIQPADTVPKLPELLDQRRLPDGNGLNRKKTSENSVLFRVMASDRKPGGFFTAEDDLVLIYQCTDILESNRRFKNLDSAIFRNPINKVRSSNAASNSELPSASFDQIVCQKSNKFVRRDERSIVSYNPKSIAITVGR